MRKYSHVNMTIKNKKNKKSAEIVGILCEFIKHSPHNLYVIITNLFNLVLNSGIIPKDWCIGMICALFTKKRW